MKLAPLLKHRFFDSNGAPFSDGKIWTYEAESTTPLGTFANADGATNTNPIELDANGECDLWLDPTLSYKLVLTDANDTPIWTVDKVTGLIDEDQLLDESITTEKIEDEAVTEAKIGDEAVTTTRIADEAITTAKIVDDAITVDKIDDDAVITAKILDLNVTTGKIADLAVTMGKLAALGQLVSSECTNQASTASFVDITNLTGSYVVKRGSLVVVAMVPGTGGQASYAVSGTNVALAPSLVMKAFRDSTSIGEISAISLLFATAGIGTITLGGALFWIDPSVAPGTYTYKIQMKHTGTGASGGLAYYRMIVFEL